MSASNWGVCPQCKRDGEAIAAALDASARGSYGKVLASEYEKLVAEARAFAASLCSPEETLREDYSQGVDEDGEYLVSYSCGCTVCGFGHTYEHSEKCQLSEAPND